MAVVVPIVFDKPLNIWLGLVLLALLLLQVTSGVIMAKGKRNLFAYHIANAGLIAIVAGVHAFYGIGIWFFNFRYG